MTASVSYALNGQVVGISAERAELWRDLDRMLSGLSATEPVDAAFRIDIVETPTLPETPEGTLAFDGEVPEDGHCRMIDGGDLVHLVFPGRQTISIHTGQRRAEIRTGPGVRVTWTAWMLVLDAALDASGQYMLHTAGLTLPGSDAVVLIHAPSGTGKTTTSLALASQGFGLCADDSMILDVARDKAVAWGLPRHVKIHRKTAELVPLVLPCLGPSWDRNGEQAVSLERLGEILRVENIVARPVSALLHLARSADGESRLHPMARTDAMVALAADNVRTGMTGLLQVQKNRLATIARLVTTVPTFTLEVGARPADAARLIQSTLSAA
ncbi:serine kinase [Mesorhizobium abyssinicae]|uniref:serine kinase n=1 Tax=Mesorhizobium abyssinicae TaxID=1209958 RepID=UPI002A24BC9A|nr:serine kinase [Mesorhizobium abyssinicae]MDX8431849.1 serine kinase [Mesorhizobium abyssinicae]